MSNLKTSDETILGNLLAPSGTYGQAHLDDDQLPDPIEPVVVHISETVTSEDEADRWANAFLVYGAELLGDAITIVKETRSPRAIEVANKLLKDLFDSAVKMKEVRKKDAEVEKTQKEDNNNIKMTPAQLLQMIKANAEESK